VLARRGIPTSVPARPERVRPIGPAPGADIASVDAGSNGVVAVGGPAVRFVGTRTPRAPGARLADPLPGRHRTRRSAPSPVGTVAQQATIAGVAAGSWPRRQRICRQAHDPDGQRRDRCLAGNTAGGGSVRCPAPSLVLTDPTQRSAWAASMGGWERAIVWAGFGRCGERRPGVGGDGAPAWRCGGR